MELTEISRSHIPERAQTTPERDLLQPFKRRLLDRLGTTLRPSATKGIDGQIERQVSVRSLRRELFGALRKNQIDKRQAVTAGKRLDEALRQYMYQEDIKLDLKDAGKVSARYCLIDVDGRLHKKNDDPDNNPIVVIGGLRNDLASMESFLLSLGVMGRPVIMIGHPGSAMGEVNQEWVKRQQTDKNYSLDAQFFKQAIAQIIGSYRDIRLIGHSYGGPVVAEMLGDQSFSGHVTDAAIVCPSGSVDQGEARMKLGIISEVPHMFSPSHLAKYIFVSGKKSPVTSPEAEQDELKRQDFDVQMSRAAQKNIQLGTAQIKNDGTLLIINGQRDQATQSANDEPGQIKYAEDQKNFGVRVITLQNEPHSFPLIRPFAAARLILERWKDPGLKIATKEDLPRFSIADWAEQQIPPASPKVKTQ